MSRKEICDLSLMSWNILAPCWVKKEWYPSSYDLASDFSGRFNKIISRINSLNANIIMIQEAQEDYLYLFKEKLNENYLFEYTKNNPSQSLHSNGLLTLIEKKWIYSNKIKIYNGILDSIKGEAIQLIHIPSHDLYFINIHLDYIDPLSQIKLINNKSYELLGKECSISLIAGDFNSEKYLYDQFQLFEYRNVFDETEKNKIIRSYYADSSNNQVKNPSIDHIFYDPKQLELIESGKAWNELNKTLQDSLELFGSDHIFIWAKFYFKK